MGLKRIAAFGAVYVLWGGSYLAIRYVVHAVPPFFAAGVRYSVGGLILIVAGLCMHRSPRPTLRQVLNSVLTGIVLLTFSYGVIYWAETLLSSWVVAVLVSTVFLWTYLGECLILRLDSLRLRMLLPVLAGLIGMPLLLRATLFSGQRESLAAGVAVLCAAWLWSATTLVLKKIDLPASSVQTAAIQLTSSGLVFFCISALAGEPSRLPPVREILTPGPILGMTYLVIAGSAVAFTAFQWLLAHESVALVATASYVNPIVAMVLGIILAHESCSPLQLTGAAVILLSVLLVWYLQHPRELELEGANQQVAQAR